MEVEYLFQIGDNIVYPMHGAGIIKAIEDKEVLGKVQRYYIINMTNNGMDIMIPTDKICKLRFRAVTELVEITNLIQIFQFGESDDTLMWKQRYKLNTEKIKTGNIQDGAEVVRDLLRLRQKQALNESERKMLGQAQGFLLSELALIEGITEEQMAIFC
ncbi:MAG: CarD family transcriptional regulator [Bacillus sp. (in: firmicutes)]